MTKDMKPEDVKIVHESALNDRSIYLHTNYRVSSERMTGDFSTTKKEGKAGKLFRDLTSMTGVQGITMNLYKVLIDRSLAWEWKDLLPHVEELIRNAILEAGGHLD